MISEQQERQRLTVQVVLTLLSAAAFFILAAMYPDLSWYTVLFWFLAVFLTALTAVFIWVMVWTWKNPD